MNLTDDPTVTGMHDYREYLYALGLGDSTVRNYTAAVRKARDWADRNSVDLITIDATNLRALARTFIKSAATWRTLRCSLIHYWEMHDRWDAPARAIKVPPAPEPQWRGIDTQEAGRLIKVSVGWHPEGTAMLMGLYLGARRSEIAAARWDKLTRDFEWITIMGKGARTRTLRVHRVLRAQLRNQENAYVWMFPGQGQSHHVHPATIGVYIERVAIAAGLDHLTPHQLRHTAADVIDRASETVRVPKTFLGHARTRTTEGYLDARVRQEDMIAATDALDAYLEDLA